jgi:hypothetical protein
MVKMRLNCVLFYFYIYLATTTKLLHTKEPIDKSFAVALKDQDI